MAVKTKQVLENELKSAEARAAKAEKELEQFKKDVAQAVADCNDEYGLNLCQDGLDDFHDRLGIDPIKELRSHVVHISLSDIELEGHKNRYGSWEFDDDNYDELTRDIEDALKHVKSKWEARYIDIEVEEN